MNNATSDGMGILRDAVSALQNLHSLLHSPRAALPSIEAVLGEIRLSCEPVAGAVGDLLDPLGRRVSDRAPLDALISFLAGHIVALVGEIAQAEKGSFGIRSRLRLESEVTRRLPEIEAARGLIELVIEALEPAPVLDISELLEASLPPPSRRVLGGREVSVSMSVPRRGEFEVKARPRLVVLLLRLGAAHLLEGGVRACRLRMPRVTDRAAGLEVTLDVGPAPTHSEVVTLVPPRLIAPTAGVLQLVARETGVELRLVTRQPAARLLFKVV
jgi:hypothetical protein